MTSVLLLRLVGPMQSWGLHSRFSAMRDTGAEPSKSGVIGLLAAALGRPRGADIADLAALRMGVRVDQEGHLEVDFHTAGQGGIMLVSGKVDPAARVVSQRHYLADARFLAALEGDPLLLETAQAALQNPHWPLFLGRKAFLPSEPVWLPDGLRRDTPLAAVLASYPWLGAPARQSPERLRLVLEDPHGPEIRPDQPVLFTASGLTQYAPRHVRQEYIPCPEQRED